MLSVKLRGQNVATFRFIAVRLMETLAAWVPTTPEMEAKLLFGEHIWDCAQHADAFGKRTHELRLPLQHSMKPREDYVGFLGRLASLGPTVERIAGFYRVALPRLGARLRLYLGETDALMDAPTVRIIERIFADQARMIRQSEELLAEFPALRQTDERWVRDFAAEESAIGAILAAEAQAGAHA
ncbi:MAG TPA: hypothetical protein VN802_20475 [Stellaceae bacterium]|nr:hypothetical protein [Stellaceae bacterium]